MKDYKATKVIQECERTDIANSKWFNQLVQSGQFYKPLTKLRELDAPNQTKEKSTTVHTEAPDSVIEDLG